MHNNPEDNSNIYFFKYLEKKQAELYWRCPFFGQRSKERVVLCQDSFTKRMNLH